MLECVAYGMDWEAVYNWNVDEFSEVYHAVQRNNARSYLRNFSSLGQAFGGDKKSVKQFVDTASAWLPAQERNGGVKTANDFVEVVRKGLKLKKD